MTNSTLVTWRKLNSNLGSGQVVAYLDEKDRLFFVLEVPNGGDQTKDGAGPRRVSISIEEAKLLVDMSAFTASRPQSSDVSTPE